MRLFVGIHIPEDVRKRCVAFQNELSQLKLVNHQQFHFTLKFLGEQLDTPIIQTLEAVAHNTHKSFEIEVYGCGAFPNQPKHTVVWVGVRDTKQFVALAQDVQRALQRFRSEEHAAIIPHLTIARADAPVDVRAIVDQWKYVSFGRFTVRSFVLYQSVLTTKGSVYSVVKKFGLK